MEIIKSVDFYVTLILNRLEDQHRYQVQVLSGKKHAFKYVDVKKNVTELLVYIEEAISQTITEIANTTVYLLKEQLVG